MPASTERTLSGHCYMHGHASGGPKTSLAEGHRGGGAACIHVYVAEAT